MKLNTITEIIEDLKQGKMVIIMDDEDRENEGDLIMAAEAVTANAINFMATHGKGLICLPITEKRAKQLDLAPQTARRQPQFSTNFTVSIEASKGVTTGISAADRATTIKAAIADNATPEDLVQPGHVFPIVAQPGGVLTRAGHTEASCDLAQLAGFSPSAVIVEVLNEDGTMARRSDLEVFAQKHDLKIGTIADLIEHRLNQEKTVVEIASNPISIRENIYQLHTFKDIWKNQLHYALVKGKVTAEAPCFVRVHVRDELSDLFELDVSYRTWSLNQAINHLEKQDNGVVVVLADPSSEKEKLEKFKHAQDEPSENGSMSSSLATYGIGAQILVDLGVQKMRLLSKPTKFNSLSGFNLEVVEYIY